MQWDHMQSLSDGPPEDTDRSVVSPVFLLPHPEVQYDWIPIGNVCKQRDTPQFALAWISLDHLEGPCRVGHIPFAMPCTAHQGVFSMCFPSEMQGQHVEITWNPLVLCEALGDKGSPVWCGHMWNVDVQMFVQTNWFRPFPKCHKHAAQPPEDFAPKSLLCGFSLKDKSLYLPQGLHFIFGWQPARTNWIHMLGTRLDGRCRQRNVERPLPVPEPQAV